MNSLQISNSLFYFLIAGLCEIGGSYPVWLWLREGKGFGYAALGGVALILYGIIPTLQRAHFGRVYAFPISLDHNQLFYLGSMRNDSSVESLIDEASEIEPRST